jgi:hypothetical protein
MNAGARAAFPKRETRLHEFRRKLSAHLKRAQRATDANRIAPFKRL